MTGFFEAETGPVTAQILEDIKTLADNMYILGNPYFELESENDDDN